MPESAPSPVIMDINQIRKIIPHRFPFLLIDRVIELDGDAGRIVALKNVTINEQHFLGHYPHTPVMPGVLMIEAMAQAAAILMLSQPQYEGKTPYFTGIDEAKFRRIVTPGDQLRIEVQAIKFKSRYGKSKGRCLVDGQVAVEAVLTCMVGESE